MIDTISNLDNDLLNEPVKKKYLMDVIFPEAVDWIEKLLKVRPRLDGVSIPVDNAWCDKKWDNGKCRVALTKKCGNFHINLNHYDDIEVCATSPRDCQKIGKGGNEHDFILYAAGITDRCEDENLVAYASSCYIDTYDGNPLVGYLNLCPNMINPNDSTIERNQYVHIIVHEIFHALGFSESMFSNYLFYDGFTRTRTTRKFSERGEEKVTKMITENTVLASQQHFNCPDLNGMELEGGGGPGTILSHTEERIFHNDFMNGVVSQTPKISIISLSVLQDTGWYRIRFENAETLYFGYNQGCKFAEDKCLSYNPSNPDEPIVNGPSDGHFCNKDGQMGCLSNREGIGICNIQTSLFPLPSQQQYFGDSNPGKGGTSLLMDYCPHFEMSKSCLLLDNNPEKASDNYYGEYYSPSSRCLFSTLRKKSKSSELESTPKCYNITCDYRLRRVIIHVYISESKSVFNISCGVADCEFEKIKTIPNSNWLGSIKCPKFDSICLKVTYIPKYQKSWMWLVMLLSLGLIAMIVSLILVLCTMFCFFTIFCTGVIGKFLRGHVFWRIPIFGSVISKSVNWFSNLIGMGKDMGDLERMVKESFQADGDLFIDDDEEEDDENDTSSGTTSDISENSSSIVEEDDDDEEEEEDDVEEILRSSTEEEIDIV